MKKYIFPLLFILQTGVQYNIFRFLMNADYRYYFADKDYERQKFMGKFSYILPKSKQRILYEFKFKMLKNGDTETSSGISIELII